MMTEYLNDWILANDAITGTDDSRINAIEREIYIFK